MHCPNCGGKVIITPHQGEVMVVCKGEFSNCWIDDLQFSKLEQYINNAIAQADQAEFVDGEGYLVYPPRSAIGRRQLA